MKRLAKLLPKSDWNADLTVEDQRLVWMLAKNKLWNETKYLDDEIEAAFEAYLRSIDLTEESVNKIKQLKSHKLSMSLKMTCAMLYHGYLLQESIDYVRHQIADLLELPSPLIMKDIRIKTRAAEVEYPTATLFEQLEDVMFDIPMPNFSLVIDRLKPTTGEVEKIKKLFIDRYQEIKDAISEDVPEVVEAYSHRTKKELKHAEKWYIEALAALGQAKQINEKSKGQRKFKAPKAKNQATLTKFIKYQKSDETLGLSSIKPDQIIGAKTLVCFNTKTRTLHYFVAKEDGLGIYRSSIDRFNEETSFKKKLRKPKEQLDKILSSTRAYFEREIKSIKSKPATTVGRIGSSTLILKAYRQ